MAEVEYGLIEEFLKIISSELIDLAPKVLMGVIIVVAAFLILRIIGYLMRKVLTFADVDGMMKKYAGIELPFSFNSIVIALLYIAVILAAIYGLINIFLGEAYIEFASTTILYGARVVSVIIMALLLFITFSALIERIRMESRLKGYLFFIIMLLLTAMLIDVTALSEPVKNALYSGLAVGIGVSLAVFAVWFFFHEYLDRYLERKEGK